MSAPGASNAGSFANSRATDGIHLPVDAAPCPKQLKKLPWHSTPQEPQTFIAERSAQPTGKTLIDTSRNVCHLVAAGPTQTDFERYKKIRRSERPGREGDGPFETHLVHATPAENRGSRETHSTLFGDSIRTSPLVTPHTCLCHVVNECYTSRVGEGGGIQP